MALYLVTSTTLGATLVCLRDEAYLNGVSQPLVLCIKEGSIYISSELPPTQQTIDTIVSLMPDAVLKYAKTLRTAYINENTSLAILSGFTHAVDGILYTYTSGVLDQMNLIGLSDISKSTLTSYPILVQDDNGSFMDVMHTPKQVNEVILTGATYKYTQIGKGRYYKNQIANASTILEVANVVWA